MIVETLEAWIADELRKRVVVVYLDTERRPSCAEYRARQLRKRPGGLPN